MLRDYRLAPPMGYPKPTPKGTLCGLLRVRLADVVVAVKRTFVRLPRALRALALETLYPTLSVVEQNSSPYVTTERARATAACQSPAPYARSTITDPTTIAAIRQQHRKDSNA